jgi:hypothetical protein
MITKSNDKADGELFAHTWEQHATNKSKFSIHNFPAKFEQLIPRLSSFSYWVVFLASKRRGDFPNRNNHKWNFLAKNRQILSIDFQAVR